MVINHNDYNDIKKTIDCCIKNRHIQLIISLMLDDPAIKFIQNNYGSRVNVYTLKRIYNNTHIPKLLNLACKNIKYDWVSFITPGNIISDSLIDYIDKCIKCNKEIICLVDNYNSNHLIYNNIIIKKSLLDKYLPFSIYKKNNTFIEFWKHLITSEKNNIINKENIKYSLSKVNIPYINNKINITHSITNNLTNNHDLRMIEFRKINMKKEINLPKIDKVSVNTSIKTDINKHSHMYHHKVFSESQHKVFSESQQKDKIILPLNDKININVVMISIDDFSNDGFNICQAINGNYNITINHILCKKHPFSYPYKILFKKDALYFCNKILQDADIVHLKGDNILVNYKRYFKIPKDTPIITTVSGSMFRRKKYNHLNNDNQEIMNKIIKYNDKEVKLQDFILDELCQEKYKYNEYSYSKLITALSCDIVYDNMIYTPPPIPKIDYNYNYDSKNKIIIGHSPSNKYKKGTDEFIIPAINLLKDKGYDIELKLLTGDYYDVITQKKNLTLFIDQCYTGWYGTSLIEAIQYGIPSLCYISSEAKSKFIKSYPDVELPIIEFTPNINDIVNVLEEIINDFDLNELSIKTKEYYDRIHNYQVCATQWNKLYRSILIHAKNKQKKTVLLYSNNLCSKMYKYAIVFNELNYYVELYYSKNDYIKNNKFKKIKVNNANEINLNRDLIIFRNTSDILMKLINKIDAYLIIDDIKMIKTESDNIIRQEKTVLNTINCNKVFFTNKFLKDYINIKFTNKFVKSSIIPNMPIFQQIPKNYLPKLNLQDNKIHIVLIGSFSDDFTYKNMEDIIDKINEFDNIVLHIVPNKKNKVKYDNCIYHETQSDDYLITYLTQFDVGLMFYNIEYDYSNYTDISISNKFYDYLYADLPMIMNNTLSYRYLNTIYKCGINIDYIELNRINEIAKKVKNIKINIDKYENTLQNIFINNYKFFD